jgi:hypothetical protein
VSDPANIPYLDCVNFIGVFKNDNPNGFIVKFNKHQRIIFRGEYEDGRYHGYGKGKFLVKVNIW